ncbi:AraC family transcriptional regulator [Actinoplanes sp. NPDC051851]|uniref:helix-turn-helix transcriptional regulator n=1 Tax=Actinoplanes sp. NPDC051851 TaxID=3154753 RepID=UPI00343AFBD7
MGRSVGTRLGARDARGVPVAVFDRVPGAPSIGVGRLPGPEHPAVGEQRHTHDFLVLFYARRAGGSFRIDERSWTVTDGDLFVLAPGQVLSFPQRTGEMVGDGWVAFFPADVIRTGAYATWRSHPLLFSFARGADRAQRLRIPEPDRDAWSDRFAALGDELRGRRDGYRDAAQAHLTLLLVALARLAAAADVGDELREADEPLLAAVFDVIERRYHEPISLADVAAEVALTPGHLTTAVRRKTGRTVQRWLAERRMQEARVLLTETDLTVAAVGRRVGYPDTSYFIRRFRADHQVTPARWRGTPSARRGTAAAS